MFADNKLLGNFLLDGIPPAPRGVPQVEVTFDVDANGILNVKAKDKTSGKEQTIKIEASSGLSKEEIAKMQSEADAHASEDEKKKAFAEKKNEADHAIHTAEKSLSDAGDKIDAEIKKEVMDNVSNVKSSKESNDIDKLTKAINDLNTSMYKIGEAMKTQNANESANQNTSQENNSQNSQDDQNISSQNQSDENK